MPRPKPLSSSAVTPFDEFWAELLLDLLQKHIPAGTLSRACAYANPAIVTDAVVEPDLKTIVATVEGSGPRFYTVELIANGDLLLSDCTCPVGFRCKHVAAVALLLAREARIRGHELYRASSVFPAKWHFGRELHLGSVIEGVDSLFEPAAAVKAAATRGPRIEDAVLRRASEKVRKLVARTPPETPPQPPAWWREFLATDDPKRRKELVTEGARKRMPGTTWAAQDVAAIVVKHPNPVQGLRVFESAVEKECRYYRLLATPADAELQAFLASDEAHQLWEEHERGAAEKKLIAWLDTPLGDETPAAAASMGQLHVTWDGVPVSPGIEALIFRVRVLKAKGGLTARSAQSLFQIMPAMERGDRSFGPLRNNFLKWVLARSEISAQRYGSHSVGSAEDRTLLPVPDIFAWVAAWGDSELLRWEDGGPVRFVPSQARLTLSSAEEGKVRWTIAVPEFGDQPAQEILLNDARILVESEDHGRPRWPAPRIMLRLGDSLRPLDTGGMPYEVVASARLLPEPPLGKLAGTRAGLHLARRLVPRSGENSSNPFIHEVPVRPAVELRLENGKLAVRAHARAEDGGVYIRLQRGVWEPTTAESVRSKTSTEEMPLAAEEAAADSAAEQTPPEHAPAEQPASSAPVIATQPRWSDVAAIDQWLDQLVPAGASLDSTDASAPSRSWILTGPELAALLQAWAVRPRGVEYLGDKQFRELVEIRKVPRFKLQIDASGIEWLRVSIDVEEELEKLSVTEVADALAASESELVLLKGGRVYRRGELETWRNDVESLASLGLQAREGKQRLHALHLAGAPAGALEKLDSGSEDLRRLAASARNIITGFKGIPQSPVEPFTAEFLRCYQRSGADFLVWAAQTFGGAVLADDMGLGKTLQVLAAVTALIAVRRDAAAAAAQAPPETSPKKRASKKAPAAAADAPSDGPSVDLPTLVVCPASVVHNWQREAERFAPSLRVLVLESGRERQNSLKQMSQYDMVLVNYALLRRDIETLSQQPWLAIVADEAQMIKNPKAEVTRAMGELTSRYRFALTGTPIENRITDLWSIVDFAIPGYLGPLDPGEATAADPVVAARFYQLLRARLRPALLRRMKAEVAPELPERIETRHNCVMGAKQRKLYLAELKRARSVLEGAGPEIKGVGRIQILAALTRLRQICCDPLLVGSPEAGSAKVAALLEVLTPILEGGHKVLVFSQFVKMLDHLRSVLQQQSISCHTLTGQTTKRGDVISAFEQDERACVFLISLKAGGTGLNLTSASHVVLFDPWWNPAVEAQAIDRTHRIGQDKTVVACRLVTEQTIEERILELQQRKLAMVKNVLEEDTFNRTLSKEDLEFLLSEGR